MLLWKQIGTLIVIIDVVFADSFICNVDISDVDIRTPVQFVFFCLILLFEKTIENNEMITIFPLYIPQIIAPITVVYSRIVHFISEAFTNVRHVCLVKRLVTPNPSREVG